MRTEAEGRVSPSHIKQPRNVGPPQNAIASAAGRGKEETLLASFSGSTVLPMP